MEYREENVYNTYSNFLKEKFGEKVYKIPIKQELTCPNRDGNCGVGGCIFCSEEGGSHENLSTELSVTQQLEKNIGYIGKRYNANKFIAYFQNFTNTYLPLDEFKKNLSDVAKPNVVGISISTRPDCVSDEYLEAIQLYSKDYMITFELGLQTVNYKSLIKINRGHTLAEFIDAAIRIKKFGYRVCTHIILNLPWDDMVDVIECAKILSALGVDEVKLHSLYITDGTVLGEMYKNNEIEIISQDEYEERVINFLSYLSDDIVVQRIIGRAPEENSLFVNWNTSWWKIRDNIVKKMVDRNIHQGTSANYLNKSFEIKSK
ncbi:MAG: TIGR01212 family radical SAM protein [Tissierellia bacterium]|nr:TIGR01212 family radical SAM protein [Tissierellia bacterium]